MNTNQLKRFAQDARRKLLEQVGAKLLFVLNTDTVELREKADQIRQLREELGRSTKEQLIEKVAYTWFNRLMALRFMDANDYQPLGVRIITPKDGYTIPELLDEAKRGNIPDELKLNRKKVFDLLDNRIPSSNPQNEAYKELLIAACNHLSSTFPFLFEKINDYTELLLPDDLTSDLSIVIDIRKGMQVEDCKNVEIIGWLYQFYISEKKDEVFTSKAKIKREDIPAATQLFTPRWIVEYMVQNTLGKLWLQNRPKSNLIEQMPYYIESESSKTDDHIKVNSPEEIKLLDPACGSGHILVYAFDLFTKIYEEEGYNTDDIPKLIIEKNLHGFEIDDRAAQLSGLALMMKAREYQRRAFRKEITPNILCYQDLQLSNKEINLTIDSLSLKISENLMSDLLQMQQAKNIGSLIIPQSKIEKLENFYNLLCQSINNTDVFKKNNIGSLIKSIYQLIKLSQKFHCIVMNPPYMGNGNMNFELSNFVKFHYPDSKIDLMVCFMERAHDQLIEKGFLGMINIPSWMFLSSFSDYRKKMIKSFMIQSLLHLGRGVFGADFGTVTFTFSKTQIKNNKGVYRRLFEQHVQVRSIETIRNLFLQHSYGKFIANQSDFENIPGCPIAYWLSIQMIRIFKENDCLKKIAPPKQGLATGNNDRFLRFWFETSDFSESNKWFPINKGGEFRKWYGNNNFVVNWENNGKEIKNNYNKDGKLKSRPQNQNYYFKEGITWSTLSAGEASFRYSPKTNLFETKGSTLFPREDKFNIVAGFLNSVLVNSFLKVLSPTLDFHEGPIGNLPFKINCTINESIVLDCFSISKEDWDSRESSWDFKQNELLRIDGQDIEESLDLYKRYWKNKFLQLHKNEEELNRQFIEIYELKNELAPNIPLEDITILREEIKIKNGKFIFNFNAILAQYISYAIGCIFGRYSLDKKGLIIANQEETLNDYFIKIGKQKNAYTFIPDEDNIIPVLDNEWFGDDIVARFYQFLKVTFGEKNFNKNLAFIEEHIGKDIRKYFIKDFYPDHIKRYKKRPIYWMFSSPKGSFNVLIYIHRYTPDTISNILNKYLKEFISKLKNRREYLVKVQVSGSPSEKTKAIKESDNIEKLLIELNEYERDILYPLATERIAIDLDDGVLVNYNKFGKAVKEVSGLNDAATKKKVKEFDWIDTTQIR